VPVLATPRAAPPLASFAELVEEYQSMVFSLAYHCLHDAGLAEEVAQDVFFQLYRKLDEMKSQEHLKHWLRKVTTHRAIDRSRRRKARPQVALEDVPVPAVEAPGGDPLLASLLGRLVASLPERPRIVLILHYQEDLNPVEIAAVLDLPVKTVRSHLQRSLALLREKIARSHGDLMP
jgi:RNA polymerase sigma-70 factor, ECF subfamily